MSRTDTWMPLYVADYLADTMALSAEEHGAYLLLLMDYWRHGPLLDDDKKLAAIARVDRRSWNNSVGPAVRAYFAVGEDGRLHQKRMDGERQHASDLSAKRRIAGATRRSETAKIELSIGYSSIESMAEQKLLPPTCPEIPIEHLSQAVVPDRSANLRVSAAHKSDSSGSQKNMLFPMPKFNDINGNDRAIAPGLLAVCSPFASVLHDSGSRDLVHKEERKEERKEDSLPRLPGKGPPLAAAESAGFERFYRAYPRKVGRQDASKAYVRARRSASEEQIYVGLKSYEFGTDPRFYPHPATWLNKGYWDHQPALPAPAQKNSMQAELERLSRGRG